LWESGLVCQPFDAVPLARTSIPGLSPVRRGVLALEAVVEPQKPLPHHQSAWPGRRDLRQKRFPLRLCARM